MNKLTSVKRVCTTAVCIALCYVLPLAFHAVGMGSVFSPMHIPVLLCGLVCGGWSGLLCGIIGPILSSVLSGMPPAAMLVSMVPELCAYGLLSGLLMKAIHTGKLYPDLYAAMLPAMLAGRIVGGIASALFYLSTAKAYSLALWASSYFVKSLPGIFLQLVLVPLLVYMLTKAKVLPQRYAS